MRHQAPGWAEVDRALRKRARSSPRAGSVLVWIVAALQRLEGRRPCRCFRARPCRTGMTALGDEVLAAALPLVAKVALEAGAVADTARPLAVLGTLAEAWGTLASEGSRCGWAESSSSWAAEAGKASSNSAGRRWEVGTPAHGWPVRGCQRAESRSALAEDGRGTAAAVRSMEVAAAHSCVLEVDSGTADARLQLVPEQPETRCQ